MHRLLRPFAALVLLLVAAPAVLAQAWPTARPIRMIVSASPGTLTDSIGRYYADHLAKAFGQQVIVDNKPGAANLLAMQAAKAAPADGYTLLLGTAASFATNPHLMKTLPYDPLKDFVPVALLSRPGFAIAVNSKMPVKTLPELVAYAKTRPDGLAVAVDGPRNFTGLSAAYLSKATGDVPRPPLQQPPGRGPRPSSLTTSEKRLPARWRHRAGRSSRDVRLAPA